MTEIHFILGQKSLIFFILGQNVALYFVDISHFMFSLRFMLEFCNIIYLFKISNLVYSVHKKRLVEHAIEYKN